MANMAIVAVLAGAAAVASAAGPAAAEPSFCVTCVEPDRTYVCRVRTPQANPGPAALRFYCIVRTAREERHKSCAVNQRTGAPCAGIEKTYTYRGPGLPDAGEPPSTAAETPAAPDPDDANRRAKRQGPPDTLVEFVPNATRATGRAVRDAAGTTGKTVRNVAQGTGKAARGAGRTVGGMARNAVGCVWSLFRSCGRDDDEALP